MRMGKAKHSFHARIQLDVTNGGAWVEVPFDVKEAFGSGRPRVKVVFDNKVEYRGSLVKMGGSNHLLGVRKNIREALAKKPGDYIEVEVQLDDQPRVVEIPEVLEKAFNDFPAAKATFLSMSYSHQREHVEYILSAVKDETRERRARKTVETLLREKEL